MVRCAQHRSTLPFPRFLAVRGVTRLEPTLLMELTYRELMDGRLRDPVYLGQRINQSKPYRRGAGLGAIVETIARASQALLEEPVAIVMIVGALVCAIDAVISGTLGRRLLMAAIGMLGAFTAWAIASHFRW